MVSACAPDETEEAGQNEPLVESYSHRVEHPRFAFSLPDEPEAEVLSNDEKRYTFVTNEFTLMAYYGKIREDVRDTLNSMSQEDALMMIGRSFEEMFFPYDNYIVQTTNFKGNPAVELVAPEDNRFIKNFGYLLIIPGEDDLIQFLISSPEMRIVNRERRTLLETIEIKESL